MSSLKLQLLLGLAVTSLITTTLVPAASAQSFAQPPSAAKHPAPVEDDAALGYIAPSISIDRAALRATLAANRAANLARFRAYRIAGVYPSNVFTAGSANIWRDQDGHYCAAATIIRASGETALVDEVADDNNFIRLADVRQGPVMDWILTSGLTQAELVLIQRPFRPVTERPQLAPSEPIVVDAGMRAKETRRLAKLYRQIEARLARQTKASLEAAVDRLMQQPSLARQLLASRAARTRTRA